ncbi:uncharacterized protein [Typha latifolia]|uniref:uncharacterized protein n=1 Tax=Typha latifolia TaxID=4733 RepID=UPI003C2DDF47
MAFITGSAISIPAPARKPIQVSRSDLSFLIFSVSRGSGKNIGRYRNGHPSRSMAFITGSPISISAPARKLIQVSRSDLSFLIFSVSRGSGKNIGRYRNGHPSRSMAFITGSPISISAPARKLIQGAEGPRGEMTALTEQIRVSQWPSIQNGR